jgi:hypothetical protein
VTVDSLDVSYVGHCLFPDVDLCSYTYPRRQYHSQSAMWKPHISHSYLLCYGQAICATLEDSNASELRKLGSFLLWPLDFSTLNSVPHVVKCLWNYPASHPKRQCDLHIVAMTVSNIISDPRQPSSELIRFTAISEAVARKKKIPFPKVGIWTPIVQTTVSDTLKVPRYLKTGTGDSR